MSVVISGSGSISGLSNVGGIASAQSGSVIQTVQTNYSTQISTSSGSWTSTPITATITPQFSNSKILAIVNICDAYIAPINTNGCTTLYRNSTNLSPAGTGVINGFGMTWGAASVQANVSFAYLDSPATTSATTYTVYYANYQASGTFGLQWNGGPSTITLLEIAA
jgi:hypothetical protein